MNWIVVAILVIVASIAVVGIYQANTCDSILDVGNIHVCVKK